jgi:hypothetical protein
VKSTILPIALWRATFAVPHATRLQAPRGASPAVPGYGPPVRSPILLRPIRDVPTASGTASTGGGPLTISGGRPARSALLALLSGLLRTITGVLRSRGVSPPAARSSVRRRGRAATVGNCPWVSRSERPADHAHSVAGGLLTSSARSPRERLGGEPPPARGPGQGVVARSGDGAFDGAAGELRAPAQAGLLTDTRQMVLHRARRDVQLLADLVVGQPVGHQAQDLELGAKVSFDAVAGDKGSLRRAERGRPLPPLQRIAPGRGAPAVSSARSGGPRPPGSPYRPRTARSCTTAPDRGQGRALNASGPGWRGQARAGRDRPATQGLGG